MQSDSNEPYDDQQQQHLPFPHSNYPEHHFPHRSDVLLFRHRKDVDIDAQTEGERQGEGQQLNQRDQDLDDYHHSSYGRDTHPDIVSHGDDDSCDDFAMPIPAKRRQSNVNGTAQKPSILPPSTQSTSGPANTQGGSLSTARSVPSLATASRTRNGLIRERLKLFDASREPDVGGGAGRHGRSWSPLDPAAAPYHSSQGTKVNNLLPAGGRHARDTPGRRPLFGEVIAPSTVADESPGYGIPQAEEEDNLGHMHRPNAMFSRSRSHSDFETPPALGAAYAHHSPARGASSFHQRSRSDARDAHASRSSTVSPSSGRNSPALQTLSLHSKIPIRTRRASDMGMSKAQSRQPSTISPSPIHLDQKSATSRHTSRTCTPPMILNSRRYEPPKRLFDHGHTLTATVKPPLPKLSPPLRSTRTRQHVTNASTSASRSKVADRFKPTSTDSAVAQSKPKPFLPGHVDVAARRIQLQKNLQQDLHQPKPARHDLKVILTKKNGAPRRSTSDQKDSGVGSRSSSGETSVDRCPPLADEITLDQDASMQQERNDPSSEIAFDESLILPLDSGHVKPSSQDPMDPMEPSEDHSKLDVKQLPPESLLKHVMSIRQSSPSDMSSVARTQLPDDLLSEFNDGETIQIVLGETPEMVQNGWNLPEQAGSSPEAFHTPREERGGSDDDIFDGRSSIYPDDSVSVVFQRKYMHEYMAQHPPPPLPANGARLIAEHHHTLDSDARSQINRVLDQYQNEKITPEMAHGFRRQVELLTPEMPRHEAWEQPAATRDYLDLLLDLDADRSVTPTIPLPDMVKFKTETDSCEDVSDTSGGLATTYASSNTSGRKLSDPFDRDQIQHNHTGSTSTLRPSRDDAEAITQQTVLEENAFPPAPPPKDFVLPSDCAGVRQAPQPLSRPSLSELNVVGGLGLTIVDVDAKIHPPPKSPLPPTHAPPPPPPSQPVREESSISVLGDGDITRSPSVHNKKLVDAFVTGLPESPSPRGRARRGVGAVDSGYQRGSVSGKASLEIPSTQRSSSTGILPILTTKERDGEKDLTERKNRIKELVDTEHSFHQDMTILMDIYMATSSSVLGDDDRRILFGNLEHVRNFTTEFLDALKQGAASVYTIPRENRWHYTRGSFGTSHTEDTDNSSSTASLSLEERVALDRKTTIGQVFNEYMARIEKVYGDWLKGHTAANKRLIELQKLPAVKYWLDECHNNAKDITAAWSLDSLIIKPAQRLLKYPLLLNDLSKTTPVDHPDHSAMKLALEQITAAAGRINDLKRRAELVEEAMSKRRESDSKMKVGKLLNRRTEKLKQQVGLSNLAEDQDYESVSQKFGGHFFQLQVVMRDVEKYLEDVQIYMDHFNSYIGATIQNIQTDQERHPEQESKWLRFATNLSEISDVALPEHVSEVRRTVIDPISHLWRLHVGPQKMMAKRKKRLVEYVKHKTMVEKGERPDKKLEQDAELFKAVNETLKEELPKLYALTKKLVDACLLNFIELQQDWQYTWQRKLEPFVEHKDTMMEMGILEFFCHVALDYSADIMETEDRISLFGLCNGQTLEEAQAFLSPATTFSKDDDSSKRPSMTSSKRALSLTSEHASLSSPHFGHRGGENNMGLSPLVGSFPMPEGLYQTSSSRGRASSAISSRGPSSPHSISPYPGATASAARRPHTSSERSGELSPAMSRVSLEPQSRMRPDLEPRLTFTDHAMDHVMPGAYTPDERYSGIFTSALPLSASPRASSPELGNGEAKIMFLAASLFEFHIDSARKEAGYPYLTYQPGEIFDVIGQKGELWLAKNQDDAARTIGWIWEKHFARILPEN